MPSIVEAFVEQIIAVSQYEQMDHAYLCNRVLALVGEEALSEESHETDPILLKNLLVTKGVQSGHIGSLLEEQEIIGASLMDLLTPSPSRVNQQFWETYQTNPEQAIADFYKLSQQNDYIKLAAVAKNQYFTVPTEYGELEITINLSKPEKDPKAIAKARLQPASLYPKCLLCVENEGYQGRLNHPARANHRIIRLSLGDQEWGFQYSPYAYYQEHAILLQTEHVPMAISSQTFAQLLQLLDVFPGYFMGSNSDLPIAGGSILSHNHYQGGRHRFAMEEAAIERFVTFSGFEMVEAGIVKWPMSVIRLTSASQEDLVTLATKILDTWRQYSDQSVQILASSHGQEHHTITPIARKKENLYQLDLVLRDNQTSEAYPDGIYHPHPDVQHIKKENIGLIEVMGLAILPPRLKEELAAVADYLLGRGDNVASYHQEWAERLKEANPDIDELRVTDIIQTSVGHVFARVLEDAGVYKRTAEGQAAFDRFLAAVGLVEEN